MPDAAVGMDTQQARSTSLPSVSSSKDPVQLPLRDAEAFVDLLTAPAAALTVTRRRGPRKSAPNKKPK
jgi:hypothetical protein